jgi:hypothetical protein
MLNVVFSCIYDRVYIGWNRAQNKKIKYIQAKIRTQHVEKEKYVDPLGWRN